MNGRHGLRDEGQGIPTSPRCASHMFRLKPVGLMLRPMRRVILLWIVLATARLPGRSGPDAQGIEGPLGDLVRVTSPEGLQKKYMDQDGRATFLVFV